MYKNLAIATAAIIAIFMTIQVGLAAQVSVVPSYLYASHGETFTVNIRIDPEGSEVFGAQYELHFNNSLLTAISQDKGPFFGSDSSVLKNEIDNTLGWLKYGETRTKKPGVTEPGVLTTITFRAIEDEDGISRLNFTVVKLSDPYIAPIPANVSNGTVRIGEIEPQSPFMVYGYIFYENGSKCNDSCVNITNLNTGEEWRAETDEKSNYYQLVLSYGTDINIGEPLRFEVTGPDGDQPEIIEHTVTENEVKNGGIFNLNITLRSVNAQTWYLTSEVRPAGAPVANDGKTHVKDNLMHKGSTCGTGTYFNLNYSEVAWFYADTGAKCDLGFGEKPWEAHIRTEKIDGGEIGHNLTVEICRLENGTGNVTVIASGTLNLNEAGSRHLWNVTCEDNPSTTQDFNASDWLAVRLSWDCPTDKLQIYYGGSGNDSYIESPSSDPGYPVPELPAILLLSAGLVVLVVWRRKKY